MNFVISILCCTCSMDIKAEPEYSESDEDDNGHGVTAEPVYSESDEDDNGHGVTAEPEYSESDEDDIRATSSKDEVLVIEDTDSGIDR